MYYEDTKCMDVDLRLYKNDITSQSGENGIIEKIFEVIKTKNRVCVEVGGYNLKTFSNVFPLWEQKGWYTIIIEGDKKRYREILRDYQDYIKHHDVDGSVKVANTYVTITDNHSLDNILKNENIQHDFDLLSIDIDGLDYYVWKSLNDFKPQVVIIEINPTVPPHMSLKGNKDGNYVGVGIFDMCRLGNEKGMI